jgi:hypothetical protein
MLLNAISCVAAVALFWGDVCDGFLHTDHLRVNSTPATSSRRNYDARSLPTTRREAETPSFLSMAGQFDTSKPVFDPLSLRAVRGDAVVRYDSLNQSEPLRINLYAFFGLTFLSAPWLAGEVGYDDAMNATTTVVSILLALTTGGLFLRECKRRSKQLTRIEKELNTEALPIRLPTNPFSDTPFSKPVTLKELKATPKPPRIVALYGNESMLQHALNSLAVFGQRLTQASVFVVAVSASPPTPGETMRKKLLNPSWSRTWLADAHEPQIWRDFFRGLSSTDSDVDDDSIQFRWFGLNSSGRSFGSGDGAVPQWLQVLGQYLRPTDLLDISDASATWGGVEDDSTKATREELLDNVKKFYAALTTGDQIGIEAAFSKSLSREVTEVRTWTTIAVNVSNTSGRLTLQ